MVMGKCAQSFMGSFASWGVMIGISVIDSRKIYRHACILQQFLHNTCTITDLSASGGTVVKTISIRISQPGTRMLLVCIRMYFMLPVYYTYVSVCIHMLPVHYSYIAVCTPM